MSVILNSRDIGKLTIAIKPEEGKDVGDVLSSLVFKSDSNQYKTPFIKGETIQRFDSVLEDSNRTN